MPVLFYVGLLCNNDATMTSQSRYKVWGGSLVVIALIVWAMIAFVRSGVENQVVSQGELAVPVTEVDWIAGNASSTVTLVEYSDFQCPACASYHPVVKKLLEEKGENFRLVYRHFPLISIHMNADLAAKAAEAAGKQGKFWQMSDKLFTTQVEWSTDRAAVTKFTAYAAELGLDTKQFASDLEDRIISKKINDDYKGGRDAGVLGTPTFFLNGKQIQNPQSYEAFAALIDEANTLSNATSTAQ